MKAISQTTIMLATVGILATYVGFLYLIIQPYKEICTCTADNCSVTRYYLNRQTDEPFIQKKDIVVTRVVSSGPGRYNRGWPTYCLKPVFETNYHTKFGAQRDYDTIIFNHKSHTTRHNYTSIWLFLLAFFALKASYEYYKEEK